MAQLNIRKMPDALKREIKLGAVAAGKTLDQYACELLRKALAARK
jgi:plasmid stability protein